MKFKYLFRLIVLDFSPESVINLVILQPFKSGEQLHIESFFSFFQQSYTKDYYFAGEVHDFWECVYVIDGSIRAVDDEKIYDLNAGDLIFHQPMALHKFSILGEKGANLLIFSYTLDGPLKDFFKDKVFTLTKEQKTMFADLITYMNKSMERFNYTQTPSKIWNYLKPSTKSQIYLQRVVYYIYQIFLSLVDDGNTIKSSPVSTPETEMFKSAVNFMVGNLHNRLTVSEIAKHCSISESGLKRLFNKYAGMSVHKYFLSLKLNAAAKLLQSNKTVTEVSELLNFSSQSYFSAAFKRETGKKPSEHKN